MLEQLYDPSWLERRASAGFVLGLSYSVIGIATAVALFPKSPGLASVAFTSLLLVPTLNRMLSIEEKQAADTKGSLLSPFRNHSDIISVYLFIFLGILLAYSMLSLVIPNIAATDFFGQQLSVAGLTGKAYATQGLLANILVNNLIILALCTIIALVYGSGAIFLLAWIASVWGSIFALIAKNSAAAAGTSPLAYFALTIILVFPHMILEAGGYFLGVITGGIMSKAALKETSRKKRLRKVAVDAAIMMALALCLLIVAALIEVYITRNTFRMFRLI
ncbi:stage II sporulation protein M [Candidatus Woesearchaeota archaeon]|nr:stage II sporulation protein M [Candidatus Woesearchaeota archaeon]